MQDTTRNKKSESGSVLIMIAVLMFMLLGFSALGMEGGRWFLVRAELSKSVDAGALAAARNIANPWVTPQTIAAAYANANFPAGFLGTPGSGSGSASFTTTVDNATNKVTVTGNVSAMAILAQIWGFNAIPVASQGTAQRGTSRSCSCSTARARWRARR
jgi:Flp pilus assembly protein TadG